LIDLVDKGMWTYVMPGITEHEALLLHSLLALPVPEGEMHPWAWMDGLVHFLRVETNGTIRFPRGLTPGIVARLTKRREQVRHREEYSPPPIDLNHPILGKLLDDGQRQAAIAIASHREGVAGLHTRFGKSYVTAAAWILAGRPVAAMVAPRVSIISQVARELSEFLGEEVGTVCAGVGKPNCKRLTICSPGSVLEGGKAEGYRLRAELKLWWERLAAIYWDESHIAGDRMFELCLAAEGRHTQWALSATPFVGDPIKDMGLVAMTGPQRLECSAKDGAKSGRIAGMEVRWITVQYQGHLHQKTAPWMKSKTAAWAHYYKALVVDGQEVNQEIARLTNWHVQYGDRVLIVVDRIAHGKKLGELIPYADINCGPVKPEASDDIKRRFNSGESKCVVVTKKWQLGITLHAEVMINAEGMKAAHVTAQKSGRGMMKKSDGRPLIVYDFEYHDPKGTLHKHSVERSRTYHREGWPQSTLYPIVVSNIAS